MPVDPLGLVPVASFRTEWQAEALAAALTERGVKAVCHGGMLGGWRAETPAMVQVMVARQDQARARELLAEVRSESVDIDWDEVDVGTPAEPESVRVRPAGPQPRISAAVVLLIFTVIAAVVVVLWLTQR